MKNKIRVIFQSIFLLMILYVAIRPVFDSAYVADFEAYCPFGGLSAIASNLNLGSLSCQMSSVQIALGIGLLVGVIIFGKLFCSYVCPIGSITEWLGKIGDKLKMRIEMPNILDRPMRSLKYVLLFLTLYFTMISSELFCKEYDPYFAVANLFGNTDIVIGFAIASVAITILGAIFFRLFWCKYLCPLGAISNIFYNVVPVGAFILLFIITKTWIFDISYIWLVAGISLIGLLTEVIFKKSFLSPATKIVRTESTCTNCKICEAKCPQGIELTQYKKVDHIDCNLCMDCVYSCPVKQSLKVADKKGTKYLAPIAVVVLIAVSLGFADNIELSTISERWNNFNNVANIGIYEQSDLKNVKCFGSAMSLKNQIDKIEGIHGIDAYAASHSVKIYYDADKLTPRDVRSAIFKPSKQRIRNFSASDFDSLSIYRVGIDKLFDNIDFLNLVYALRENDGVYGFETEFGEPVQTSIYFRPDETSPNEIEQYILKDEIEVKKQDGVEKLKLQFEIHQKGEITGKISTLDYQAHMFSGFSRSFNKYNTFDTSKLSVLIYPMPEADHPMLKRQIPYLMSHISHDDGIVRLTTAWDDGPKAYVFFAQDLTPLDSVKKYLSSDTLYVTFTSGEKRAVKNPFKSKPDGIVKPASEVLDQLQ